MPEPPVCDRCGEPIEGEKPVYLLQGGPLHDRCANEAMLDFLTKLVQVAKNEERKDKENDANR